MEAIDGFLIYIIIGLALLAIIPAKIASGKGHSFWGYYVFGLCFFLPSLIVALLIEDKNKEEVHYRFTPTGSADEIAKYKKLLDDGAITKSEYEDAKRELLGSISYQKTAPTRKSALVMYEFEEDGTWHEKFTCPECGDVWLMEQAGAETEECDSCGCKVILER